MIGLRRIDCTEAEDRAPFFVLGALSSTEAAEVHDHLATCSADHPEFAELGGVVPYLAELAEPVDVGPELKERVMAAITADVRSQTRDDDAAAKLVAAFGSPRATDQLVGSVKLDPLTTGVGTHTGSATRLWVDDPGAVDAVSPPMSGAAVAGRRATPRWLLPAAAVLLIAVLGGWNISLLQQSRDAERRASELRTAVALSADPSARVARMAGNSAAPAAGGYAAFRSDGTGVLILDGLTPAPAGRTYQAWYIGADKPRSAGIVRVESDGLVIVTGLRAEGPLKGMALTVEPAGGVEQPTGEPIVVGNLTS